MLRGATRSIVFLLAPALPAFASQDLAETDLFAQFQRSGDPLVRILALPAVGQERKLVARRVRDRLDDALLQRMLFEMGEAAPGIDAGWFAAQAPRDKYHWVMKLGARGVLADESAVDTVLAQIASPQTQATGWRELLWRIWQAGKLEVPSCLWERDEIFDEPVESKPLLWTGLASQWATRDDYRLLETICAANRLDATPSRRAHCLGAGQELELGETAEAVWTGQKLQLAALESAEARAEVEKRRNWPLVNGIADGEASHRLRIIEVGEPRAKLEFQARARFKGDAPEILAALPPAAPAAVFEDAYAKARIAGASLACAPDSPVADATESDEDFDLLDIWTRLGSGGDPVVTWLSTFRMHPEFELRLAQAQSSHEPIIQRSLMLGAHLGIGVHRGTRWLRAQEPQRGLTWLYVLREASDSETVDQALAQIAALGVESDYVELHRRFRRVAGAQLPVEYWDRVIASATPDERDAAREFVMQLTVASNAQMHSRVPALRACTPADVDAHPDRLLACLRAAQVLEASDAIHVILDGLGVQRALVTGEELAHVQERIAAWERIDALDPGTGAVQEGLAYFRELEARGEARARLVHAARIHGADWAPLQATQSR